MKKHFLYGALIGCSAMILGFAVTLSACGAFKSVTPADRAAAYAGEAVAIAAVCKAYRFDRDAGLTNDVQALDERCR